MNFSKTTSYSLLVLSHLARHENIIISASTLHKQLEIPYSYLRTVLLDLSKKGLIDGVKGRSGGFCLSRGKKNIFLSEIVDATEGLDDLNKCIMGFDKCPFNSKCFLHPVWERMRSEILDILTNTSLADHIDGIYKSK